MSLIVKTAICFIFFRCFGIINVQCTDTELDTIALKNLIDYLRIPSVHPNVNYDDCVNFLTKQAESLKLEIKIVHLHPKKPIVIITWNGTEPKLPSILLNGHMDVVPVNEEEWKYPPFGAKTDDKGNIYARGVQDMKSLTVQHLEAIRRLKLRGVRLKRTIHISVVPDEETGGDFGMKSFVETQDFKNLNIGFAMDEGDANAGHKFNLYYGERTVLQIWVHCNGTTGHSSELISNTAAEKLRIVINRFMDFREREQHKLKDPVQKKNVTSINLTLLRGGTQVNVIPNELSAAFDIRVSPFLNFTKFEETIKFWLKEAGEGVSYSIIAKNSPSEATKLDSSNIYWRAFKKVCDENFLQLETGIMAGATDSRYLRSIGIPALGFSPMNNTIRLAHANNELLNKIVFLRGIGIIMKIMEGVASV